MDDRAEGRPLGRDERTYVPMHESPGEIAELEGDQKFVPLPRSNRKAVDGGEYTLDVHKQLKKAGSSSSIRTHTHTHTLARAGARTAVTLRVVHSSVLLFLLFDIAPHHCTHHVYVLTPRRIKIGRRLTSSE